MLLHYTCVIQLHIQVYQTNWVAKTELFENSKFYITQLIFHIAVQNILLYIELFNILKHVQKSLCSSGAHKMNIPELGWLTFICTCDYIMCKISCKIVGDKHTVR